MKILILICLSISLTSFAGSKATSGTTITTNRFNGSTFIVGSIQTSLLTLAQFQAQSGTCWVKMTGQSVAGSDYATLTGNTMLPDATGQFLRNAGGLASNIGTIQTDSTSVNGLSISAAGNHNHYMTTRAANTSGGTGTPGGGTGGSPSIAYTNYSGNHSHAMTGDAETRPANMAVNMFIKINYSCN